MGSNDPGVKNGVSAAGAQSGAGSPGPRPTGGGTGGRLAVALLAGAIAGALGGYAIAARYFSEQVALLTQAADLRVKAADARILEVEEQQREFVQQADAQQREILAQSQEQELTFLQRANERERKLAQPDLPLRIWMRAPRFGPRLVVKLHNFGTKDLSLAITAHRPASNEKAEWQIVIPPNANQDIGTDASWTFAPGDNLEVTQSGYRPMTFPVKPRAAPSPPAKSAR